MSSLEREITKALEWIASKRFEQAVVKLVVTRSGEATGYSVDNAGVPNIYLRASELVLPEEHGLMRVAICKYVLPKNQALAGIKHLNRLDQIMASRELDSDHDEGLLMDEDGLAVEGISSNLFLVHRNKISTPRMERSGVKGVMRQFLLDCLPEKLDMLVEEKDIQRDEIATADELLVANAVRGVRNVGEVEGVWKSSKTSVGDRLRALIQDQLGKGFCSF